MTGPLDRRRAGVLLHLTSLPAGAGAQGELGGDLGPAAYRFVDWLADAGCTVWQVLPLVPTHPGDRSPYNAPSAMAGNPELVSLELLADDGLVEPAELAAVRAGEVTRAQLRTTAAARLVRRDGPRVLAWAEQVPWLPAYVEFTALRELHASNDDVGAAWSTWEPGLRDRDPAAVAAALAGSEERIATLTAEQWLFEQQWQRLRRHAADRNVLVFGDMPIFVSLDSADVWAHRSQFLLDARGRPTTVTGVPPDYFAADGQRWNNPHYDWAAMAADGFAWWRARVGRQRSLVDLLRIDHFRGFEASWHIPADAETAKDGRWEPTPGREVLAALRETAGAGSLVAEDLGEITPAVDALRREAGLPGMKVLQFAFDGDPANAYLPHAHEPDAVVYTGTHDNDTTVGWWREQDATVRAQVRDHVPGPEEEAPWPLVRAAFASVARLAVVPAQDLLALGSDSRMNVPGTGEGNWSWQAPPGAFTPALAARVRALATAYDRAAPAAD